MPNGSEPTQQSAILQLNESLKKTTKPFASAIQQVQAFQDSHPFIQEAARTIQEHNSKFAGHARVIQEANDKIASVLQGQQPTISNRVAKAKPTAKSRPISEVASIAQELNTESKGLNETIAAINDKLREYNFGIEVWSQQGDGPAYGYCRTGDPSEWQLAVRTPSFAAISGPNNQTKEFSITPLLKRSRDERILGLDSLPSIIDKLKEGAKKRLDSIHRAKQVIAEL